MIRFVARKRVTGEHLKKVTNHGLEWGTYSEALHFTHPYRAWGTLKSYGVDPQEVEVYPITVMYTTDGT